MGKSLNKRVILKEECFINKKKIYSVKISQTFNAFKFTKEKWYKTPRKEDYVQCLTDYEKLILANSEEEAIEIYKNRRNWWNINDKCIDSLFEYLHMYSLSINHDNPNYACEVIAKETHNFTFNKLKDVLRAEEFFEYCKQEMFPIEVILDDK